MDEAYGKCSIVDQLLSSTLVELAGMPVLVLFISGVAVVVASMLG